LRRCMACSESTPRSSRKVFVNSTVSIGEKRED